MCQLADFALLLCQAALVIPTARLLLAIRRDVRT